MFLQSERIDIFFRNKKQHLVSALAQHFGDGQAREKVPAGSSACNDRVHRMVECDCAAGGSSSPLLDVKVRRQSRIFFGIARGAADPPGNPKSEI
jgi:hypothetical protein